jgi:hypothetical protein
MGDVTSLTQTVTTAFIMEIICETSDPFKEELKMEQKEKRTRFAFS